MKKELMKKLYLKEVVITLLFIISTFIYLNVPYKALDLIGIKIEKLDKSITEISLYQSKDIDFISGYKKSIAKLLKAYHKKWDCFGKRKNGSKKSRT